MQRPVAISYAVFAVLLIFLAALHLGTPFLAALFCYLALSKLAFFGKKWIALVLFLIVIAAVFSGAVFFLKRAFVVLPEIVETALPIVVRFASEHGIELPFTDIESLRTVALDSVRNTLGDLGKYVRVATKEFLFLAHRDRDRGQRFHESELRSQAGQRSAESGSLQLLHLPHSRPLQLVLPQFRAASWARRSSSPRSTPRLTAIFVFAVGLPYASLVIILTFVCGIIPDRRQSRQQHHHHRDRVHRLAAAGRLGLYFSHRHPQAGILP